MPTAEEVFSETFGRFISNWSFVVSLRQISEVALPLAAGTLAPVHANAVEAISADPDYNKVFIDL